MPPDPAPQAGFRAAIFDGAPPDDVTAPDPAETARRFAVHRNNVMASLTRALSRRFPVIERLVGPEFATAMFGAFVRAHPPDSPLMMLYGARMPGFLETFPPVATLPYLADVARIERARGVAYHAADAAPVDPARLASLADGAAESLRLVLHPSVQVLSSPHPAHGIWAMNQPGAGPRGIAGAGPEDTLVARSGLVVLTARLSPAASAFTGAFLAGGTLGDAAEAATARDPEFDPAAELARLIGAGLVTGADGPGTSAEKTA